MKLPGWLGSFLRRLYPPVVDCPEIQATRDELERHKAASMREAVAADNASKAIDGLLQLMEADRNGAH